MKAGPDFLVLTGFLGSGKTTLLRDFLALPEAADTAVIVNEAGEIGLDGAILAEGRNGVSMKMLDSGCICCTMGTDLSNTVEALLAAREDAGLPPLQRIVLETSGLSRPGPVLRSLRDLGYLRMRVGVVCTYDVQRGMNVAEFPEAAAQWAAAQVLVPTKTDTVKPEQLAAAYRDMAGLNPLARVVTATDRQAAVLEALTLAPTTDTFAALADAETDAAESAHARVRVLLARPRAAIAWDDWAAWLDNLAGLCGERLLRLKGLLWVQGSGRHVLMESVGTMFSAPRPFVTETAPFLVVILRDLDADVLRQVQPEIPLDISTLSRVNPFITPRPSGLRAEAVR